MARNRFSHPLDALRHHVTGAIERGEATPITERAPQFPAHPAQPEQPYQRPWRDEPDEETAAALLDQAEREARGTATWAPCFPCIEGHNDCALTRPRGDCTDKRRAEAYGRLLSAWQRGERVQP